MSDAQRGGRTRLRGAGRGLRQGRRGHSGATGATVARRRERPESHRAAGLKWLRRHIVCYVSFNVIRKTWFWIASRMFTNPEFPARRRARRRQQTPRGGRPLTHPKRHLGSHLMPPGATGPWETRPCPRSSPGRRGTPPARLRPHGDQVTEVRLVAGAQQRWGSGSGTSPKTAASAPLRAWHGLRSQIAPCL